jgi:tetratricopeptide (TPR) repeat protein
VPRPEPRPQVPDPQVPNSRRDDVVNDSDQALNALLRAEQLLEERRTDDAVSASREALAAAQAAYGDGSEHLIRPLLAVGRSLGGSFRELAKESSKVAARAVDLARQVYGGDDIRTARVLCNLALSLRSSGLREECIDYCHEALAIATRLGDVEYRTWILREMTLTLILASKYLHALPLCEELLVAEEQQGDRSMPRMMASYQVGLCMLRLGRRHEAVHHLERARALAAELRPGERQRELEDLLGEARLRASA